MVLAVVAITVITAAGLSIALSGGGSELDRPTTAPLSSSDLVLLTPVPTGSLSFGTLPTGTPIPIPSVAAHQIRAQRIQIRRLDIDLKIIEGDGIDAPIGKAAHYPGSGWPDGGTNVYIYAHARTGMFLSLWDARIGDEVLLTLADGTKRTYLVDTVVPRVPWDAVKYLKPTQTEQLTLQTSTSYYPTAPRFVVLARPTR